MVCLFMDPIPSEEAIEEVNDTVCLFRVVSCTSLTCLTLRRICALRPEVCPWKRLRIIGDKQKVSVYYVHDGRVSLCARVCLHISM